VSHESKERRRKAAGQGETDHGVAPGPTGETKPLVKLARGLIAARPVDVHYHVPRSPGQEYPVGYPAKMSDRILSWDYVVVLFYEVRQIGDQMPSSFAAHRQSLVCQGDDVPGR